MAERGLFMSGFTIQRKSRVSNGKGGHTFSFSAVSTPRGRLSPLSLAEQERAKQNVGVVTHRFSCAGDVEIKPDDRLVFNSRTLDVKAVSTTSTGLRKQSLCEEVTDGS